MSLSAALLPTLQGVPLVFSASYLQNEANLFDFNVAGVQECGEL